MSAIFHGSMRLHKISDAVVRECFSSKIDTVEKVQVVLSSPDIGGYEIYSSSFCVHC